MRKCQNHVIVSNLYCKVLTTKNVETEGAHHAHAICSNALSQTKWCEGID